MIVMGAVSLAAVVLFALLPGKDIRAVVSDQTAVDDLVMIESAINEYVNVNGELPKKLSVLELDELKNDLKRFTFTAAEGTYFRLEYELCFDGFKSDTSKMRIGGFNAHNKGEHCFELYAFGDMYFNEEDDDDYGYEYDYDYDFDYDFDWEMPMPRG